MPQAHSRPVLVAFDVVETLLSLDPLRARFRALGLAEGSLDEWFACLLRDAFALGAAEVYAPFREVAAASLAVTLERGGRSSSKQVIDEVLSVFSALPAHADVRPAFTQLRDAGVRIATLTNGSAEVTRRLLTRSGLEGFVERTVSIDEVKRWKPRREVYLHAANVLDVEPPRIALVAAHAWDILGAARAGLLTGWVARREATFHRAMGSPTVQGRSLDDVMRALLAL